MKKKDLFRAWRDGAFYASLSAEEKAAVPTSPAAMIDVDDEVLRSLSGGCGTSFGAFCPTSAICTPCPPSQCAA